MSSRITEATTRPLGVAAGVVLYLHIEDGAYKSDGDNEVSGTDLEFELTLQAALQLAHALGDDLVALGQRMESYEVPF